MARSGPPASGSPEAVVVMAMYRSAAIRRFVKTVAKVLAPGDAGMKTNAEQAAGVAAFLRYAAGTHGIPAEVEARLDGLHAKAASEAPDLMRAIATAVPRAKGSVP